MATAAQAAALGLEHWKVTMLGDGGVGKTALAVQFTQKQFIETYDPTIEDSYRKQVLADGKMSFLEIIDTAGQEDYSTLREQWIREGQGFILVYSVTNQTSFQNVDRFRKTMISLHPEIPVFLIIGNKADDAYRREVSAEQGLTYARRHNCEFFEASAKSGQNVEKLFSEVVRQLRANNRSPQPLTPNSTTSTSGRGSSRTSASGYTAHSSTVGTATPLTVPSSGSLGHQQTPRGYPAASGAGGLGAPRSPPPPSSVGKMSAPPALGPGMSASGSTRNRGGSTSRSEPAAYPIPGRDVRSPTAAGGMPMSPPAPKKGASSAPAPAVRGGTRLQVNTSFITGNAAKSFFFKTGSAGGARGKQKEKEKEEEKSKGGCVVM
ncbi:ras-domain-containing protein [Dacryopinax primogenitus]|uniref:Ras-domain-containing protein n=1 Tax=Dacryopinax primogenitus (strain DJM 731) TaxID=1858805 RepID=M5GA40_DACPD|nr:ras-domain-containing protein [Dacryopinax primogenitus]EJU00723.1 ras-domain-containing protein [Dacryopinax primogenitus]